MSGRDLLRSGSRIALPWAVAIGCIAWAFRVVPFEQCLAALRNARLSTFLPLALAAVAAWFLIESAAYAYTFSRFDTRLSFRDARSLRALTYLLTIVHWHLAKAAVVFRLHTAHGVGLVAATSTLLLYQMIGTLVLALLATLGALTLPPLEGRFEIAALAASAAGVLVAILVLLRSDAPRHAGLDALRALPILRAHRRLSFRDVAVIGLAKASYQLIFVFVYFAGLRTFGLSPSFAHVLVATPVLQAIGGLPIAPAGFGTQQAAILFLFADPALAGADGPALLAFGFSLPITTLVARCLLACLYLGDLSRVPTTTSPSSGPADRDAAAGLARSETANDASSARDSVPTSPSAQTRNDP